MTPEIPLARYLPPHLAEALRQTLVRVPDSRTRSEVTTLIEETFAVAYSEGYHRGYPDGAAERDAELSATDLLMGQRTELQVRVSTP